MKANLPPPLPASPALAWRWPAPALAAWLLAWAASALCRAGDLGSGVAWLAGLAIGLALAMAAVQGGWRRLLVAAGFPVSSLVLGAPMPDWGWAVAALVLLSVYPVAAWRDAPF